MLGLVRDDVLAAHKESALSTRIAGRWQRWLACWRELAQTSLLFRIGTQGAFALGLGLLLSMAWVSAIDKGQVSADSVVGGQENFAPETTWKPRSFDLEEQPPAPLGDLPKEVKDKPLKKK